MLYKHRFTKYIYIIFGLLIIFNFLHYFNINNFNDIIEPYYASGPHLIFFGRNTLGDPDTKRMLGTMGNPNNNGILFLFFTVLFSLKNNSSFFKYFLFYLCFIAILFCQSRTCFIIFVIIFLLNTLYLNRLHYTKIIAIAVIFILTYISLNIFSVFNASDKELSTKYLNEMIQYNMLETGTIQSRFITWNHLWDMIKEKPILGHAPYKEYFYNKKMYSENEYMLMLWRYGFIGLIFYILIIVYPLKILDNFKDNPAPYFLLTIIITALTNNPLSEPRILLMFAFFTALIYALRNKNYLDYEKITVS
ncbi:MAG: O-antigen ligase family protein [Bacteroidales bacterium]|nr:O-antigen ligase family protein [Bacteroidales bacterium]